MFEKLPKSIGIGGVSWQTRGGRTVRGLGQRDGPGNQEKREKKEALVKLH